MWQLFGIQGMYSIAVYITWNVQRTVSINRRAFLILGIQISFGNVWNKLHQDDDDVNMLQWPLHCRPYLANDVMESETSCKAFLEIDFNEFGNEVCHILFFLLFTDLILELSRSSAHWGYIGRVCVWWIEKAWSVWKSKRTVLLL